MKIDGRMRVQEIIDSEAYKKSKRGLWSVVFGRTSVIILLLILQFLAIFGMFFVFENYLSLAYSGIVILSAVMTLYIANKTDNPAIKLSWIALIVITPVFGTLLYVFVHAEIGHRVVNGMYSKVLSDTKKYSPRNSEVSQRIKTEDKELYNISEYLYGAGDFPVYASGSNEFFSVGEKMWERLLEELEQAEKFIFLEYFAIEEGEMWGSILEILQRKVKEGVEVRVLYDGTCSVSLLPYSYPKTLAGYGIKCRVFSPIRPLVSTHYNNRDHRKIAVIDGHTAFTGGINLSDEYVNRKLRFGHWKDSGVMIRGEAVKSFTLMFLQMWNVAGAKDENYGKYLTANVTEDSCSEKSGYVIPYGDSPLDHEKVGETVYLDVINNAENYVYIMTPYLMLDNEMATALKLASKRNVDVRIIMPAIPDKKLAFAIAKTYYGELAEAGVKIYSYTPGFVHSKLFVSDDTKAVAGTVNLDYRSLYLHFENGVYMYKTETVSQIKQDFDETFEKCKLITPADIKNCGVLMQLRNGFLRLLAPLM